MKRPIGRAEAGGPLEEPQRLLESAEPGSGLLAAMRVGADELPTTRQLDGLAERLAPLLGAGAAGAAAAGAGVSSLVHGATAAASPATATAPVAAAAGSAAVAGTKLATILAVLALGGAGFGGLVWYTRAQHGAAPVEPAPSAVAVVAPAPSAAPVAISSSAPSAAPPTISISDLPSTAEAAPPARSGARDPSPAAGGSELGELELVQNAQSALGSDAARALALTSDHARRFPGGALAQERDVIAIDALVRTGRAAEARARAEAFRARYPSSAHLRRIAVLVPEPGDAEATPSPDAPSTVHPQRPGDRVHNEGPSSPPSP